MAYLPAGTYYLGDPCYVFRDEAWDDVVDRIIDCEGVPFIATTVEDGYREKQGYIWSHGTAYGDGGYQGSDGKVYNVDSGCIGLVAEELISYEGGNDGGRLIGAPYGLKADYIDGLFVIEVLNFKGGIAEIVSIMTDDPEEDEDTDEDYDPDLDFDGDDDLID